MRSIALLLCVAATTAFVPNRASHRRVAALQMGSDRVPAPVRERIEDMLENKVMLFMKGTKASPSCGFSNTAVKVLQASGTNFETFDVLSDPEIRQAIKEYSDWPTIPQLYVGGEFIGGSDIVLEMYKSGELQEMLEVANAS